MKRQKSQQRQQRQQSQPRLHRRLIAVLGAAALAATLSGCGLDINASLPYKIEPGSIKPVEALKGQKITVGSKDFTENIILGYMAEMALSAAGADVIDLTDIKGSNSARQAQINGQIDLMWEYTGTGWINYQGNEQPVPGEAAQYEATRKADEEKNGITWLPYSPLNDQYAFAVTKAYAEKNGINNTTDLANFLKKQPDQSVFCLETEFTSRQDGFPAAMKKYQFPNPTIKNFGIGTIYSSIASGTCPVGEIFTTDGRINKLGLKILDDDKLAFPKYNASVTMRTEFLQQHPSLPSVLNPVAEALDNEQMIQLCQEVDVEGKDAGEVAKNWMVSKGFVKAS